ncbi:hypothetical protein [Kitasatospora sp. NPDC057223]|uniref:hypothetical protein n=1 Tax=Kitasatospora sp. NPDC057223 TaxID=3346055 RepID=UPI003633FC4B
MPQQVHVDLTVGHVTLPEVGLNFDMTYPGPGRERPMLDGARFDIEVPAVLDLLSAIAAGTVTADQAHRGIATAVRVAYVECEAHLYEPVTPVTDRCGPDGTCTDCARQQDAFDQALAASHARWDRAQRPAEYPFTVGKSSVHTTRCPVTRRSIPAGYAQPATGSPEYAQALAAFAHRDVHRPDWEFQPGWLLTFEPLTTEATRTWMAERTGPKGGRAYKQCRRCDPTP